jgi:hypothetical protein
MRRLHSLALAVLTAACLLTACGQGEEPQPPSSWQQEQITTEAPTANVSPRGAVPLQVGEVVPVKAGEGPPQFEFVINSINRVTPGQCPSELFDYNLTELPPDAFFLALDMTVRTYEYPPTQMFNPYSDTWKVVGASGTVDNVAATYSSYKCVDGEDSLTNPLPNSTYQLQTDLAATEQTGVIVLQHGGRRWEWNY